MPSLKYCIQCGNEIKNDTQRFCVKCGTKFIQPNDAVESSPQNENWLKRIFTKDPVTFWVCVVATAVFLPPMIMSVFERQDQIQYDTRPQQTTDSKIIQQQIRSIENDLLSLENSWDTCRRSLNDGTVENCRNNETFNPLPKYKETCSEISIKCREVVLYSETEEGRVLVPELISLNDMLHELSTSAIHFGSYGTIRITGVIGLLIGGIVNIQELDVDVVNAFPFRLKNVRQELLRLKQLYETES